MSYELIIISLVIGVAIGSIPFFIYISKKGVNVSKLLTNVESNLNASESVIELAKSVMPGNKVINIIDQIEHWSKIGVQNAEQLYHASVITDNTQRKNTAKETVITALKELGIEPTENQTKLIDDVIEASVNNLGHTDKTDEQKEAEKQNLIAKNQELQNNVQQLQEKINQIQCVAQK